jgi:glycosyltransferase involved in cell wall biosynthesis
MILFVGHVLPFPENTGTKIRLANLLRAASEVGPVQFVGYWDDGPPEDPENTRGIAALRALSPDAVILKRDLPWWPDLKRDDLHWAFEHYVRRSGAFVFREYACESLVREVRRLARDADVIWVERLWMAEHLPELADRIIVDIDDLESIKLKRKMQSWKLTLPVLAAWYDCWKTARTERAAARKYLRSIICSEGDLAFWGTPTPRTKERLWVIPNGFNDELLALPLPEIDVPRVIFVGTLKYWPNAEAVIMFVRSILPRLLARHPALEFWIVGRSPVDEVLALDNGSSVRVFADVPDVIDYVRQAAVSVVPLRVGGGTRLKILESIGAGVPVVSTPVGIEGIDLQPETHFLQAVTPADFADQVSRLIDDPQLRKQQVIAARGEIARRYGWGAIRRDVTAKLLALRGAGAAPSTPP